jgi:hypothetical protein
LIDYFLIKNMPESDKDAKRKKQQRKMSKILAKAWGLDDSEPFQAHKGGAASVSSSPLDLQTIGQHLDEDHYPFGRLGWERFANDLGGVYQGHILR